MNEWTFVTNPIESKKMTTTSDMSTPAAKTPLSTKTWRDSKNTSRRVKPSVSSESQDQTDNI